MEEYFTYESYENFAQVYDMFMDDIPYGEWVAYLRELLIEQGCESGLVADLGCGTGTATELLAQAGYDMIGIDSSEMMLSEAISKKEKAGSNTLYLLQDMREFELYGSVAAFVSICDSINYILEKQELEQVFRLVHYYLDPGGVFIFDFNTLYKYQEILGVQTIAENREEGSFIWENEYDPEQRLNLYDLTLFIREEDGRYSRYQETHVQKAYTVDEICAAAEQAGLKIVAVYNAFTRKQPEDDCERICMVVKKMGGIA